MKTKKENFSSLSLQNLTLNNLYKNIQQELQEVEEELEFFSKSTNPLVSEINSYLFQKSGKRMRPALLLLCSKLYGYKGKENIIMASLIEAIHTASLIHDDIIDNSDMRRGEKTVHYKWGPNISVLLGDYLYIKTIASSLRSDYDQVIQIITEVTSKMIEGELNEYYMSGNLDIEEKEYLDIIKKKTASLFSASCKIGGILGHASKKDKQSLSEFGLNLGMCFQIIDDLLDYKGNEKEIGKPILSDAGEGRITLPLIYSLNHDGKKNREHLANLLKNKTLGREYRKEILNIVQANGALDYTFKKAEEYCFKSMELIDKLPFSIYREDLKLFSGYTLYRKK